MEFNMKSSFSNYGEADDKQISKIIPEVYFPLLKEYIDFLKKHNGGKPFYSEFDFIENDVTSNSVISFFFGIHNGPKEYTIKNAVIAYRHRMPNQVLPIGEDAFGNLICMSLRTTDLGSIYFWDHESESDDPCNSLHFVAANFKEFFQSLKPAYGDIEQEDEIQKVVEENALDTLKDMIEAGLSPNYRTKRGACIVDIAAYKGYREIVAFLCTKGCDLVGALDSAIRGRNEDIALDIINLLGKDAIAKTHNRTWLFLAAEYNCPRVASELIKIGVDIDFKDKYGRTALIWAKAKKSKDVVEIIQKAIGVTL